MKHTIHNFTLVLGGVTDETNSLEDHLFEAGCDDALIHFRSGAVYLDFNRAAASFEDAVISAVKEVESSKAGTRVINILPDDLVNEADIAKRLNQTRQAVSLWTKRVRRQNIPFPNPIAKLSDKSPMWRWYEVVKWLDQQNLIKNSADVAAALFIENINAVLSERDPTVKQHRVHILKQLNQNAAATRSRS